ncbi:uncharacterized protein LOC117110889, partial [Anneissia japonica]|uniref:uncharacterized protein LOC117110889 n=1 Tax=Anneissia japonica TaxID=1529436 RepID=UPI001425635C
MGSDQSVAVPREVLARGKEARVAFNKELEKSQIIPVYNSQVIAVRELKGIVKTIKLESNVMKKLNERIERLNGIIPTATATAKAIHENFRMKQESKKKVKGNVRKKRKLSHPTSTTANVPVSSTEDAEVLKLFVKEHNTEMIANEDITYIWDFSGQQLYDITHPTSLTSDVYLIEFNLMENMQGRKRKCRVSRM